MRSSFAQSIRALVIAGTLAGTQRAAAQRPTEPIGPNGKALKPIGAHTIIGFVADTFATPLDSVELFIASLKLHATASADGMFRFADVKAGSYEVSARRFGYFPQVREVVVGDSGGVVSFALLPRRAMLPTVVSSAVRGGLSGVVGDSSYNILQAAEVTILGSDHHVVTDSTGSFFMEAKPGHYMVRVQHDGYQSRLVGVTIPNDSGRRILIGLAPLTRPPLAREEVAVFDLSFRLTRRSVMDKVYTREDITRMGATDLQQIAITGARQRVDESCLAYINGGPVIMPVWLITTPDIESVEIYPPNPAARRLASVPTSINGNRRMRTQQPASIPNQLDNCPVIYVWLRK